MPRILIVEDKAPLRKSLAATLVAEGFAVDAVATRGGAEPLVEAADLVLTDLRLPDGSGLDVLDRAAALDPPPPVVLMTAYGDVATAVDAMRRGAADFLEKPFEPDHLLVVLRRVLAESERSAAHRALAEVTAGERGFEDIIGRSKSIAKARALAAKVASTEAIVLITGESGTGKELFARAIHRASRRASGPFVAINCAAIPSELLENELFGSERGAFTGAVRRKIGRIEAARGGTLFLDEIGDLALNLQGKLLRFLQEGTFERLGGKESIKADVRTLAATNRDLRSLIELQRFREDLFYRLSVFPLELPSLRDRADDLPMLARAFLSAAAAKHGRRGLSFSSDALERIASYSWPGNVRELQNVIERAVIMCEGGVIEPPCLSVPIAGAPVGGMKDAGRSAQAEIEKRMIVEALERTDGNKRAAARELGISVPTLYARIEKYGIK